MAQHLHGGRPCIHPSKKACDDARHAALGRCVELTEKMTSCRNWAVDRVNDRPMCGQHLASVVLAEDKAQRERGRRDRINRSIDAYLARAPRRQAVTLTWHAIRLIRGDLLTA
ncbi:MAG TPA: hypothetical protein VFI40_04890 [Nocardioides sp.]|nr:hypothetical protein [Nocardioides sp.]